MDYQQLQWIRQFDEHYGIKYLDEDDYTALQVYCDAAADEGIINNSSFDHLKIKTFNGDYGQYIVTYYLPTMTIINACAMHKLPLQLNDWGEQPVEHCWRIGVRNATLGPWRDKLFSLAPMNSLTFKHIYPIQVRDALNCGASKLVVTTNSSSGKIDVSGKMFKVDRVMSLLTKKGYFAGVGEDINIFNTPQNVWELNMDYWGQ